ncbi:MAG: murein biosynthesis integral membrane protein MurJ [Anaerolineae bacterium]|nr:murein biosynthesis integral membrane protein MurJ [Anaerolineae bacterium]
MSETETQSVENSRGLVLRAAGLVGVLVLLGRIVGLFRDMVMYYYMGVDTLEAEAFAVASRFPEAIFFIIAGGAIGSAFIPTFSAYFVDDDEKGGWRLFSAVLNLITLVVLVIVILAMIFAPQIINFFYHGKIEETPILLPMTVLLMRVMLLSTVIFAASGVVMGALNARQHFFLPALAPLIYNLGIILGGVLWQNPSGSPLTGQAMGFAIGTVIGAAGHLLIQLPGLRAKHAQYSWVLTVRDQGVIKVLKLMLPRVLGLSFSQINFFIITFLTGMVIFSDASLPVFNAAFRIINLPLGIIGIALGIAAFPTLSTLAAKKAFGDMREIVTDSLRLLLFLGLPITVFLIFLAEPVVSILYERGEFGAESSYYVATVLSYFAIGLIALMILEVIARTFYSLSDTWTPVLAGGLQVAFMAVLGIWLGTIVFPERGDLPLAGLVLGLSISNYIEVALLLWLLRRKLGRLNGRSLFNSTWRLLGATGMMMAVMWVVLTNLPSDSAWIQLILGGLAGGLTYLLACFFLRSPEMQNVIVYGRRRLGI